MKKIYFLLALDAFTIILSAQNVGIGTHFPTEQLHTTRGVKFETLKSQGRKQVLADSSGRLFTLNDSLYTNTFHSPIVIPDGPSCTGLTNGMNFTGLPAVIASATISVKINIEHTWVQELRVYLVAPNGNVLNLIFNNGGAGDNFTNTVFSDKASAKLPQGSTGVPFSGNFKPTANMNAFCGITPTVNSFSAIGGGTINPNGIWTLKIHDALASDVGKLISWTLNFGGSEAGVDNFLAKWTNGSLSGDCIVYDNGTNVGIGTTVPQNKLSVGGNANFTGNIGIGTPFPASLLHLQSGNLPDTPCGDLLLSRYWASANDTRASAIFHYYNSATLNDNVAIAVSGDGGSLLKPNQLSQIKLLIQGNGNVGIGTTSPSDRLEVAGIINAQGFRCRQGLSGNDGLNKFNINWTGSNAQLWIDVTNLGNLSITSDRRLKENIQPFPNNALERVLAIKPVQFNYKKVDNIFFTGSPDLQEGFIADELQGIFPGAVNGNANGLTQNGTIQPQTINIVPIVAVLTKAIQEQQQIIQEQNKKIELILKEWALIKEKLHKVSLSN